MAEPTNLPGGTSESKGLEKFTPYPGTEADEPSSSAITRSLPPSSPAGEGAAYKPLAIVAIAAFAIACVWLVVVLFVVLGALLARAPLALPIWTLVIPVSAAVLAFAGRLQVQHSEGTLAGLALANWGLALSILTGLGYGAYMAAMYLAVRQQADDFTQEWFNRIRAGRTESAFLLTVPRIMRLREDPSKPNDPALRREIESRPTFGLQGPADRGRFSQFQYAPLVRYLVLGGDDVQVKSLGVSDWSYKQIGDTKGYLVRQKYRITTPEASFDCLVSVHGRGKDWTVQWEESGVVNEPVTLTPLGERLAQLRLNSFGFVSGWLALMAGNQSEVAYLAVCDPAEQQRCQEVEQKRVALCLGLALGASDVGGWPVALASCGVLANREIAQQFYLDHLPGYQKFREGSLVRAEEGIFWAPGDMAGGLAKKIKGLFQRPGQTWASNVRLDPRSVSIWRKDKGHLFIEHDFVLRLTPRFAGWARHLLASATVVSSPTQVWANALRLAAVPDDPLVIEGKLIVETDARALDTGTASTWRLAAIQLVRGQPVASESPDQPRAPGSSRAQ